MLLATHINIVSQCHLPSAKSLDVCHAASRSNDTKTVVWGLRGVFKKGIRPIISSSYFTITLSSFFTITSSFIFTFTKEKSHPSTHFTHHSSYHFSSPFFSHSNHQKISSSFIFHYHIMHRLIGCVRQGVLAGISQTKVALLWADKHSEQNNRTWIAGVKQCMLWQQRGLRFLPLAPLGWFFFPCWCHNNPFWQPGASILDGPSFRCFPQSIGLGEYVHRQLGIFSKQQHNKPTARVTAACPWKYVRRKKWSTKCHYAYTLKARLFVDHLNRLSYLLSSSMLQRVGSHPHIHPGRFNYEFSRFMSLQEKTEETLNLTPICAGAGVRHISIISWFSTAARTCASTQSGCKTMSQFKIRQCFSVISKRTPQLLLDVEMPQGYPLRSWLCRSVWSYPRVIHQWATKEASTFKCKNICKSST